MKIILLLGPLMILIDFRGERRLNLSCISLLLYLLFFHAASYSATFTKVQSINDIEILDVGILTFTKSNNNVYRALLDQFEKENPKIKIRIRAIRGRTYLEVLDNLKRVHSELDLVHWFAGKRLGYLAHKGIITHIEDFWLENNFSEKFSQGSKEEVRINEQVYGVPLTSYIWGFYYKKSLFERLNITPAKTWTQLLSLLGTLKENNISPIGLGSVTYEHACAWFDYLMLRLNGYQSYHLLVNGELSYRSPEVKRVFQFWQSLINKSYFFSEHQKFDGQEVMALLYREVVGINLTGSYSSTLIDNKFHDDLGFFPFPSIDKKTSSEISPISVMSMIKASDKKLSATKLLNFLAKPKAQRWLNSTLKTMSPSLYPEPKVNELTSIVKKTLVSAEHLSQFFDRETDHQFANLAKPVIANFVSHGDINKTTKALEQLRLIHFPSSSIKN